MRAVVQRVTKASVEVEGECIARIGVGFLVLVGVEQGDDSDAARYVAEKISGLRVFADSEGKMNLGLLEVGGEALVVSQFTLLGDCRKGRRPSFVQAADPGLGETLYLEFCDCLRRLGVTVSTGRFRADMAVSLINDGPVTLLIDSRKQF